MTLIFSLMYLTEFALVCLCSAHLYPRRIEGVVSDLEEGTDQVRAPTRKGRPSSNNLKLKDMPPWEHLPGRNTPGSGGMPCRM